MTTIEFDSKITCGSDFVGVRILENCEELKVGSIWLPQQSEANERMAHCVVESIGKNASEKTGVKIGDYVMIDRLATFSHTAPVACLKYDSVICFTNESRSDFFPLKDMMFVQPDDKDGDLTKRGAIYVQNDKDKLRLGTVTKVGFEKSEDYPFEVGQHVMVSKGSDVVHFGETQVNIYKKDMIICSIEG